jgi:hypothetical protein
MSLIKKLAELAPIEKILSLMLKLEDKGVNCDVKYEFKTISSTIEGSIDCGPSKNYYDYLSEISVACAYFSARGIDASLTDSKAEKKKR